MNKVASVCLSIGLLCCRLCADSWSEERLAYAKSQQDAAGRIATLLTESEPIELVSLNPFSPLRRPEDSGDHVGQNRVRMRAWLRQKERMPSVVAALKASLTESVMNRFPKPGQQIFPPACFSPQHAFRVLRDGKEIYILICYLCSTGYIQGLSDVPIEFQTSRSSRDIVEQLFVDSGLPAAEKTYPSRKREVSNQTGSIFHGVPLALGKE